MRYKEVYDIDYYDMGNYNLVIESTNASPDEIAQEILDKMTDYQDGVFEKIMELNPSSIKRTGLADVRQSGMVEVSEKCGVFTLTAGRDRLDEAVARGDKFVSVSVSVSEEDGEDSFMNFANMVR